MGIPRSTDWRFRPKWHSLSYRAPGAAVSHQRSLSKKPAGRVYHDLLKVCGIVSDHSSTGHPNLGYIGAQAIS